MSDDDKRLEHGARRLLDRAARELDTQTLARLQHARAQAWRRAEQSDGEGVPRRGGTRWWLPVGGAAVAALALAAVAALWWNEPRPVPVLATEDLELLVAREDPEFYDDLEFYQWVAAHEAG